MKIFTPNMQLLYRDIVASLGVVIDQEAKDYIFGVGPELDLDFVKMVVDYITLELIKYSYDEKNQKYPLRHFLKYTVDGDQSERMMYSRIVKYVQKYRKKELKLLGLSENEINNDDILKALDSIEKKKDGRKITSMNFFEFKNVHDLAVIKAIIERRITSVKKTSNTLFVDFFREYDDFVDNLIKRSQKSDEDMVFSSIALFTLEWKYNIESFYRIATLMDERDINTIDTSMISILFGRGWLESQFGGLVVTDSRMVKERQIFLDLFISNEIDVYRKEELYNLIREILVMVTQFKELCTVKEGGLYKDWFKNCSNIRDWASFFKAYNIFSIWERKKWNRRRIQYMRKLFDKYLPEKE